MLSESQEVEKSQLTTQYWTRWHHGNRPLEVRKTPQGNTFYLLKGSEPRTFEDKRSVLRHLYKGTPRLSFQQYFRVQQKPIEIFSLQCYLPKRDLGIDLRKRGIEVEKILR